MTEYRNGALIAEGDGSSAVHLDSLQQHIGPSYNSSRYLSVTADMTNVVWNKFAAPGPTHEVFTVTGLVRMRMWIECTGNVDSAGHLATIQFGHEADTAGFILATDEETLDTGELWYAVAPATQVGAFGTAVMDYVINGLDVGYEIGTAALNAGSLVFHCVWEPLNSTGNVVAGAGGAL